MSPTTRLWLALLIAPAGVPAMVFPLCGVEAWLGALSLEEAMLQALGWSAFGMPAVLMVMTAFWAPVHMALHSYAVRAFPIYLGLAAGIVAVAAYLAVMLLPGYLDELRAWPVAALMLSGGASGTIGWAVATSGGRR